MQKKDYRKYYEDVRKDFEELKKEYPYSTMYMPPTVEPKQTRLKVIAVHRDIILSSKAEEEDLIEEYSKELQIVIPWDYKKQGCKEDYEFMLKMFNKRDKSSITMRQDKKIKAVLLNSIKPFLQNKLAEKVK